MRLMSDQPVSASNHVELSSSAASTCKYRRWFYKMLGLKSFDILFRPWMLRPTSAGALGAASLGFFVFGHVEAEVMGFGYSQSVAGRTLILQVEVSAAGL